jgi:hypothetical protein
MPDSWYALLSSQKRLEPVALELEEVLSSEGLECEDISSGDLSPEGLFSLLEKRRKLPDLTAAQQYLFLACLQKLAGGEQQPR